MNRLTSKKPVSVVDLQFKKNSVLSWPGSTIECDELLAGGHNILNTKTFFEIYDLPSFPFSPDFFQKVKNWKFFEIICSALTFKYHNKFLYFRDWFDIICLLMNSGISDQVLSFLQKNEFHEKLDKETILFSVKIALTSTQFSYMTENSLFNLGSFLQFEKSVNKKLVSSVIKLKSFKPFLTYIENNEKVLLSSLPPDLPPEKNRFNCFKPFFLLIFVLLFSFSASALPSNVKPEDWAIVPYSKSKPVSKAKTENSGLVPFGSKQLTPHFFGQNRSKNHVLGSQTRTWSSSNDNENNLDNFDPKPFADKLFADTMQIIVKGELEISHIKITK